MMKFGEINGEIVNAVTLKSATVEVVILSFGGIIQSLKTVDKDGNWDDIVTGFDTIKEYPEKSQFFGCLVGRYANRIGGGAFEIKSKSTSKDIILLSFIFKKKTHAICFIST